MRAHTTPPASAVETSDNARTGPASATYVSLRSYPPSCPLVGHGCYGRCLNIYQDHQEKRQRLPNRQGDPDNERATEESDGRTYSLPKFFKLWRESRMIRAAVSQSGRPRSRSGRCMPTGTPS